MTTPTPTQAMRSGLAAFLVLLVGIALLAHSVRRVEREQVANARARTAAVRFLVMRDSVAAAQRDTIIAGQRRILAKLDSLSVRPEALESR